MHSLTHLDTFGTAFLYSSLTYPIYRSRLQTLSAGNDTVAIGASIAGKPVGLAMAEIQEDKSATVLSLFVVPAYRHQGIGTDLLNCLEKELYSKGCTSIEFVYTTGQLTTSTLEHLLDKGGWSSPKARRIICKTSAYEMSNASWMYPRRKLSDSYSICPWTEIMPEERAVIRKQETQSWIHPDLIPFKYEKDLEPINSLGLRYQGQVVGWLITHRITPDTIRYSCAYVRPDLQKVGRLIFLYIRAVRLQIAANIPFIIWTTCLEHTGMINFTKKHMGPYLKYLNETKGAYKLLFSRPERNLPKCVESVAN